MFVLRATTGSPSSSVQMLPCRRTENKEVLWMLTAVILCALSCPYLSKNKSGCFLTFFMCGYAIIGAKSVEESYFSAICILTRPSMLPPEKQSPVGQRTSPSNRQVWVGILSLVLTSWIILSKNMNSLSLSFLIFQMDY